MDETRSIHGTEAEAQRAALRVALEVVRGPDRGARVELDAGTALVGTHADCALALTDGTVSRRHAEIAVLESGVRVRDLGSKNGTFVGGARVDAATVPPPFELRVGSTRIEVRAADMPVAAPASEHTRFGRLVGRSAALRRAFGVLERAARSGTPMLFVGPAGVGKTAFAIATHDASCRAGRLTLLDPGEATDRAAIEAAMRACDRGTLVLEALERWTRAGTEGLTAALDGGRAGADVRLLSTSREDLRAAVEEGRFPRALWFFLAGLRVDLPPLRERPEDVQPLVDGFLREMGCAEVPIPEAIGQAVGRGLRGDARELRALVEASIAVEAPPRPARALDAPVADAPFHEAKAQLLDAFERRYLTELMARHDGVIVRAAEEAGLGRNHLARLLKKHDLQ